MIRALPWWLKIAAKVFLSRVPVDYSVWRRLGLFRCGFMDRYEYAWEVFFCHLNRFLPTSTSRNLGIMEIGPGDSLASAVLAAASGHSALLLDVGDFASRDVSFYQGLADFLKGRGLEPPDLSDCRSIGDLLEMCNAEYLTGGLASLRTVPSRSMDLIWSQAVLEHIALETFMDTAKELRRIVKPEGACSHRVDLTDHLAGSLNNLRFSPRLWESQFFKSSGFYTNRIRFSEMIRIFEDVRFSVEFISLDKWESLPLTKGKMAKEFLKYEVDDLRVSGFDVLLRPI